MILISNHIAQQRGTRVDVIHHDVNPAVIEQVTERGAATGYHVSQAAVGRRWNHLESFAVHVAKQKRPLRVCGTPVLTIDITEHVPVRDKQIEKSVIIEIKEARLP